MHVTDQTCSLIKPQYTDTGPSSPIVNLITSGAWQCSQWMTNSEVTGVTRPGKSPKGRQGNEPWSGKSPPGRQGKEPWSGKSPPGRQGKEPWSGKSPPGRQGNEPWSGKSPTGRQGKEPWSGKSPTGRQGKEPWSGKSPTGRQGKEPWSAAFCVVGLCHKTSRPVEVFCRAPQLGRQISTLD